MALSSELKEIIKIFLKSNNVPSNQSTYLETGFLRGDSVQDILDLNFKKVISIEIDKNRIEKGKKRFKQKIDEKKVLILEGDSKEKIKEIFDSSINIIFLDAHGSLELTDDDIISPLEGEINYLINRLNNDQLLIIDDFIKIRNSFFYKNNKFDWKSKLSYKKFKKLISKHFLFEYELIYPNGINSYLILTKNKKLRIGMKLTLRNLFFKLLTIKYFYKTAIYTAPKLIKMLIIFFFGEILFNKLKSYYLKNKN